MVLLFLPESCGLISYAKVLWLNFAKILQIASIDFNFARVLWLSLSLVASMILMPKVLQMAQFLALCNTAFQHRPFLWCYWYCITLAAQFTPSLISYALNISFIG